MANLNELSLEEQELLLEEASLVYYVDEETGEVEFPDDEGKRGEPLVEPKIRPVTEEEKRVARELSELFGSRFCAEGWRVEPVEISPVETFPDEKERKVGHRWRNLRKLKIDVMNLADQRLPFYSKRKYPETVIVMDSRKNVVDSFFSSAAITADFTIADSAPKRVNKPCIAFETTGYCKFGNACMYTHQVYCKHSKNECPKKRRCKFPHRDEQPKRPVFEEKPRVQEQRVTPVVAPPAIRREEPRRSDKKIFMCKYVLMNQTCRFGNRCNFSHSREELEENIRPCFRGEKCSLVKKITIKLNRNNQPIVVHKYENVGNGRCPSIHPGELTANYIKRLTIVQ